MLQIVPMAEKTEEAALLAKTEGAPDNGRVLVMTDGEETLGYVVVALEDDTLVFYGFSVSGQTDFTKAKPDPMTTFVLDTLMRSAASFGETNGMNHIRTAFPDFFDVRLCHLGLSVEKKYPKMQRHRHKQALYILLGL